jgi:hypothetical protein
MVAVLATTLRIDYGEGIRMLQEHVEPIWVTSTPFLKNCNQ